MNAESKADINIEGKSRRYKEETGLKMNMRKSPLSIS